MVGRIRKLDSKGVTLIELIVAMSLMLIVLSTILAIFSSASKASNVSWNISEIQAQGQSIMNFISARVMTSSKVVMIKDNKGQLYYNSKKEIELGELKLKDNLLQDNLLESEEEMHIFSIQNDSKTESKSIRYGKDKFTKIELGNYIKSIHLRPLPNGKTYRQAKGLRLNITMQKGTSENKIFKNIYFRN